MTGPAELHALRLRTPRLELRLGGDAELEELAALAERGIHPPAQMPFAIAWSDGAGKPGFREEFVEYHRASLVHWAPDAWALNLLVWAEGALAGTQALTAESFARRRVVSTGSWLGVAHQRRGIGTEMRAAVLELAFRGLGALAAESGWLEGNDASRRVSERLGYRETGISVLSPRGAPVTSHDVRLSRDDWRPPTDVAITGLEPCLPLFGVAGAT